MSKSMILFYSLPPLELKDALQQNVFFVCHQLRLQRVSFVCRRPSFSLLYPQDHFLCDHA